MDFRGRGKTKFAECYRAYVTSHTGLARKNNEDNFILNSVCKRLEYKNVNFSRVLNSPLLAAVFDGMGGESLGDYAALISAKTAKGMYHRLAQSPETAVDELAAEFTRRANNAIRAFLEEHNCETGGSTAAAVVIKNEIATPFSLGDSRVYLLRGGKLTQLSKDHTVAAKRLEANFYTREEAEKSPDSHKLTAFLGADTAQNGILPQMYEPVMLQRTDKLLLCSDGLYDELSKKTMETILRNHPCNPAAELTRAALNRGGSDNITCAVIEREI